MWTALLLSALSGVLLTVGLPKLDMFYLSWVALVPLFMALREKSAKEAFLLGYVCGFVHFASTLYWIRYVIYYYGGLPLPLAILVLGLLCAYLAVYPAIFALVAGAWERKPFLWVLGLPGVWVTLEWARAHALSGFPWANLGYSQTPFNRLIQVADITGVYGVSWLVVLGSTALMGGFGRIRFRAGLAVLALCLVGALVYGGWRAGLIDRLQSEAAAFPVAVVQGNIDQSLKWDKQYQQETLARYEALSKLAVEQDHVPKLLVWPETAMPFFYGVDEGLTAQLNKMIQSIGVPVLFGSPAVTLAEGRPRYQNRAYLVDATGDLLGGYAKQHLVPFGEYVPFQKYLFFVHRLVEAAGDFVPGRDSTPLALNGQRLGVLICYEEIFPELARQTVLEGATALVNITNDAWYGRTSAPYQHMEMARWLAVELRVPLVRAANTGISTIVDATGRLCGAVPLDEKGSLTCTVRPFHLLTVYARWGNFFAWLCVLTTLVGLLYSSANRGRTSK